ncbi:MAG: tRNA 2-thiocytidine biosynthesis TtcA family protein [Bacillota bacterium]
MAVGLSGGKDSLALLYVLKLFQKHAPFPFELKAVHVDLGWADDQIMPLNRLAELLAIPLHIEKTAIARVVFERRREKNPCALCANLRRGALHQAALQAGARKVALGHHLDDAIQTYLLNLIYTGQMSTFKPVTLLDRTGLTQIRPLIQIPEQIITNLARREGWPVVVNPCPASGKTKRREMANLVEELVDRYPDLRDKWRAALMNSLFREPGPE